MNDRLFDLNDLRMEISFKSFHDLRLRLSFYEKHKIYKLNIPCKNNLKKKFLLESIKISREEFPNIDIIPHFSIFHQFRRNSYNTQKDFIEFLLTVKYLGCKEVLLISGSQRKASLDSVSALKHKSLNSIVCKSDFSIGIAFNPFLPNSLFEDELLRLKYKLDSGAVTSIWLQFGTDIKLLESRIELLKSIISSTLKNNIKIKKISLFGSVLIPSSKFIASFKFRPWKGVYCSKDFLESFDYAKEIVSSLLYVYKTNQISPVIETDTSNERNLNYLYNFLD